MDSQDTTVRSASGNVASSRGQFALLGFAIVVYFVLAFAMTERMTMFSEELISLPANSARVLLAQPAPDGSLQEQPTCKSQPDKRLLVSSSRPTVVLCRGDRALPVMSAPLFTGLFLWPVELFRSVHHDNPFVIRKMLTVIGLAVMLLTFLLVRRLGYPEKAGAVALGMAVAPCFILLTSMLTHFETLPWLWLVVATLVFAGCRELAPKRDGESGARSPPSTLRLMLGAFCVGLAILANIKAVFFIVPLLALAWRLGVQFGRLRWFQWALIVVAGALPLFPILLPAILDPTMSWQTGRGSNAGAVLQESLRRPEKFVWAVRDLLMLWSNIGSYLTDAPRNPISMVVAGLVFVYVLVETIRTLVRRRGDVITTACGVLMLTYIGVVALLYNDFPANYTPLYGLYGIALGCAAAGLCRQLGRRLPKAAAVAVSALLYVPFAWNTTQTLHLLGEIQFVTNTYTEREITKYLLAHDEPPSEVITVNLLAGGIFDVLSGGKIRSLQAHDWLGVCEWYDNKDRMPECFGERWHKLLQSETKGQAVRVVLPVSLALVHRPGGREAIVRGKMAEAAHDLGLELRREATFTTPDGKPSAEIYWIGAPEQARP